MRMVAGMAKTWRRHSVFIIKDTLVCLYAFVGVTAISCQPDAWSGVIEN
jgi:hypothetical protein